MMPKGVEHSLDFKFGGLAPLSVRIPMMPKGVEHRVNGVEQATVDE